MAAYVAFLILPVFVNECSPEVIQSSHGSLSVDLNPMLMLIFRDCSSFVRSPGITAGMLLVDLMASLCFGDVGPH